MWVVCVCLLGDRRICTRELASYIRMYKGIMVCSDESSLRGFHSVTALRPPHNLSP